MLRHAARRVQSHITLDFLLPRLAAPRSRTITTSLRVAYEEVIPAHIRSQLASPEVVDALNKISPLPSAVRSLSESDAESFNKLISLLRSALVERHVVDAYRYWTELSEKGFLRLLGPAHLDMCSRYLGGVCSRAQANDVILPKEQLQYIEEMAFHAAVGGYPNALKEYLIIRLKQSNPDIVHRLYAEYFSKIRAQKELPQEQEESSEQEEEVGLSQTDTFPSQTIESSQSPSSDGAQDSNDATDLPSVHIEVLFCKIAACAMQDRFSEALTAVLQTRVRLLPTPVHLFSARFRGRPEFRRRLSKYISRIELGRILSRPRSLTTQLNNLGSSNADRALGHLYTRMRSALQDEDPWLTADPQAVNDKLLVFVPHFAWGGFLSAFLRCRRLDLAEQLWDDLARFKVKPDLLIWNSLLEGYADASPTIAGRVGPAWKAMISQGVKPDTHSYRALLQGLFYSRHPDEAMKRFEDFKTFVATSWGIDDASVRRVFNTTLHGLLVNNMETEALSIMQYMQDEGPRPNIVSFNTFMRYYERQGNTREIANMLRQIDSLGLTGDVFTFSTLLRALLQVRKDAIDIVFNLMDKQGVKPNTALYTGIIDFLLKQPDTKVLKTALNLLTRMEQSDDKELAPNEITYTNFIARILQATWLDEATVEEYHKNITQRMKERNITPTRPMYNILLKAALSNPSYEGVQYALAYFREMVDNKVGMGHDVWWIVLQGLARRKEWGLANQMVQEMEQSGFKPTSSLLNLVNKIKETWSQKSSTS